MQAASTREKMFTMRMSEDETERLTLLAEHYGLNAAGTIRLLLKREADKLAPKKKVKR